MKKYDVYGIGNALVDLEYEVTTDYLEEMKIDKGMMLLVDPERQSEILKSLSEKQPRQGSGGSAANTVIAISQLGGKSYYSCKVANDSMGEFYYRDMINARVETPLDGERPDGVTGSCVVLITPDADRTMNTSLGISSTLSTNQVVEEAIKDSSYVYVEGYLICSPNGKEASLKTLEIARREGVKTAITLSDPGVVSYFRNDFKNIIGEGVDLLFCNEDEAKAFTECEDLKAAAEELRNSAKSFAITRGSKGALLFDGERFIEVETKEVSALDTTGAGDLFAGCFLYAISNDKSFKEAGMLACNAASELVTHYGARLRTEQLSQVFKSTFSN
jgi:sugar/nucleoside kinase (ribokinase family)